MARTTLDLDPAVLAELRDRGAREGKSMGRVASELLARSLTVPEPEPAALEWRSGELGRPHVDLEDHDAVQRALERPS